MQKPEPEKVYYSPEMLRILERNAYMSPETWQKVIAADPTGWRELLCPDTTNEDS